MIADAHSLAGWPLDASVDVIYGIEQAIAEAHMTKEDTRNFANNYTKFSEADLNSLVSGGMEPIFRGFWLS